MATLPAANTFEGSTDETTISTGNSGGGSGDAFEVVAITGAQGLVYDNARAAHGSFSARVDLADSTGVAACGWTWSSETTAYGRAYVYLTGAWTGPSTLRAIGFETTTPAGSGRINIIRDNRFIQVLDANFANGATSTAAIAFDTWYRIEWRMLASTTAGELEARLYVADNASPESGGTIQTTAGANTGANIGRVTYGSNQSWSGGGTYSFWMDSLQANNTGWPGPLTAPSDATLHVVQSGLRW